MRMPNCLQVNCSRFRCPNIFVTFEEWTNLSKCSNGPSSRVLSYGQLHKQHRYSADEQDDKVRNQEDTLNETKEFRLIKMHLSCPLFFLPHSVIIMASSSRAIHVLSPIHQRKPRLKCRHCFHRKREIILMIWSVAWATSKAIKRDPSSKSAAAAASATLGTNLRRFYNTDTGIATRFLGPPSTQCRLKRIASCWPSAAAEASGGRPSRR